MNAQLSVNDLLDNASRLDTSDFDTFFHEVLTLRAKRVSPVLSTLETNLLKEIYKKLPNSTLKRYENLSMKRQTETINENEYAELLKLVKEVEQNNVIRLKSIVELATIRKITPQKLMEQLGLIPLHNA
jgi:hypothetical protein